MKGIEFREIDAVIHKEERMKLTNVSGVKGHYPQVFFIDGEHNTTYIGGFETIRDLIEINDLDPTILAKDPSVRTFDQVFADCRRK